MNMRPDFKFYWLTVVLSILFGLQAGAVIRFEDAVFPELVTSSRALAMGNAYISKSDDAWSVFYNPAGLGSIRRTSFHLLNVHAETNKGYSDIAFGGQNDNSYRENTTNGYDPEEQRKLLLNARDRIFHNRVNFFPNFTTRFFSFGYMYSNQTKATMASGDSALFEYSQRKDSGPIAALNMSMWGGVMKLGVSALYLTRRQAEVEYDKDESFTLRDGDYREGSMLLVTAGTRLTMPVSGLPTVSAVIRNTGNQRFADDFGGEKEPDKIQQTIDLGFSITPLLGKVSRMHLEVNLKDVKRKYDDIDASRRIAAGVEFDVKRTFFLRFGYGDGWGSGGIGLNIKRFRMDLTTYAVDTTSNEFRGAEDRRYAISLSAGF
jgi:hypothetical protein